MIIVCRKWAAAEMVPTCFDRAKLRHLKGPVWYFGRADPPMLFAARSLQWEKSENPTYFFSSSFVLSPFSLWIPVVLLFFQLPPRCSAKLQRENAAAECPSFFSAPHQNIKKHVDSVSVASFFFSVLQGSVPPFSYYICTQKANAYVEHVNLQSTVERQCSS